MLLELVVENYAVVERLRVHFHSGLNLLTGETGSGKSIVVDALGLLLGGRASAEMIRTGESAGAGGGNFRGAGAGGGAASARVRGPRSGGRGTADRARDSGGRKIARVRGQPSGGGGAVEGSGAVPGGYSRTTRSAIIVFERGAARHAGRVCRRIASCWMRRRAFIRSGGRRRRSWRSWSVTSRRSCGCWICGASSARKSRAPRCCRTRTRNWRTSDGCCRTSRSCRRARARRTTRCTRIPESAVALARIAAKRVEELCRIDASLEGLREHLKAAELSLQEAAYGLRDYLSGLEANPGRLEEVEKRLEAIARLKRKYGSAVRGRAVRRAHVHLSAALRRGSGGDAARACACGEARRHDRGPRVRRAARGLAAALGGVGARRPAGRGAIDRRRLVRGRRVPRPVDPRALRGVAAAAPAQRVARGGDRRRAGEAAESSAAGS